MPSGTFHTVSNESDNVSVSLQTYSMNTNYTARCQIDPATGKVKKILNSFEQGLSGRFPPKYCATTITRELLLAFQVIQTNNAPMTHSFKLPTILTPYIKIETEG